MEFSPDGQRVAALFGGKVPSSSSFEVVVWSTHDWSITRGQWDSVADRVKQFLVDDERHRLLANLDDKICMVDLQRERAPEIRFEYPRA